ncbi:hypothetical protein BJY24_006287 [Nocardia transvalensis]|uniref:DUF6194 domain-containing protein n=1 Tax=Nocardia transvalensis TaxID=37333 RepID=A0A7W9PJQ1_9NOCA|nr:DUF6194 family protein [Nocardia transvalensis]MBB5917375.1 hypothetical protein [Nocardia transvalensis]
MDIEEIIAYVENFGGVRTQCPGPGDGTPEIAWGDTFFTYSPDATVPATGQPFATIVTKNYPGDERSRLDRPGVFRLNIHAGRELFLEWTGHEPRRTADEGADPSTADTLVAHPVYGTAGWLAVVNPGANTDQAVRDLLRAAHDRARARYERRAEPR